MDNSKKSFFIRIVFVIAVLSYALGFFSGTAFWRPKVQALQDAQDILDKLYPPISYEVKSAQGILKEIRDGVFIVETQSIPERYLMSGQPFSLVTLRVAITSDTKFLEKKLDEEGVPVFETDQNSFIVGKEIQVETKEDLIKTTSPTAVSVTRFVHHGDAVHLEGDESGQ